MYNTPYDRAECIIIGNCLIAKKILDNLVILLGSDIHFSRSEEDHFICTKVDKLHNLNSDPKKAFKILSSIKAVLVDFKTLGETEQTKDFYLEIIKDKVNELYLGDSAAILFIKHALAELSMLVDDESQFSPFTYF